MLELSASPFVGNEEKLLTFWLNLAATLTKGCGMGSDDDSVQCSLDCALDNRNDVSTALFGCIVTERCMPEM